MSGLGFAGLKLQPIFCSDLLCQAGLAMSAISHVIAWHLKNSSLCRSGSALGYQFSCQLLPSRLCLLRRSQRRLQRRQVNLTRLLYRQSQ